MIGKASLCRIFRSIGIAAFVFGAAHVNQGCAEGFRLTLRDGRLHGPGNLGQHDLQAGEISNFVVTGPLTGYIPMFNNGGSLPNLSAETLHVTEVDGRLSNGVPINEHINAGFVLDIPEPVSGDILKLFVCSISRETVTQDASGNLQFSLTAGFDPGLPDYVVEMNVIFVTGVARVPKSEKTRRNMKGGHDSAGRFTSGYARVGKLGDFDQDGMLDGEFVLGGNAPFDLIIAEGDPILIVRPFVSDIPVSAVAAASYQLRGIVENYPSVLTSAMDAHQAHWLSDYIKDIELRIESTRKVLRRVRTSRSTLSVVAEGHVGRSYFIDRLNLAENELDGAKHSLVKGDYPRASGFLTKFFTGVSGLLEELESQ